MATVSGDLGDLVNAPLVYPNGRPARAYLSPASIVAVVGTQVRFGGVELVLDSASVFAQTGIDNGDYQLIVCYYDREPREVAIPVLVFGNTTVVA